MRVRVLLADESGAVLVTTILLALVMFGCAAMVTDGGAVLLLKRQMVTATDAAALAAASSCAQGRSDQHTQALETARQNVGTASSVGVVATCNSSAKTVTVSYQTSRDLSFAPLLGIDSSTVTTSATAMWGTARSAAPVPLGVGGASECTTSPPPSTPVGPCALWFHQDVFDVKGSWGFMDLGTLNNPDGCKGAAQNVQIPDENDLYELNPSGSSPVCSLKGDSPNAWGSLKLKEGTIRAFPLIDPEGSSDGAFSVLGYVPLYIEDVWYSQTPGNGPPPTECLPRPLPPRAQACVVVSYRGPITTPGPIGSGSDFGVRSVRLKN